MLQLSDDSLKMISSFSGLGYIHIEILIFVIIPMKLCLVGGVNDVDQYCGNQNPQAWYF